MSNSNFHARSASDNFSLVEIERALKSNAISSNLDFAQNNIQLESATLAKAESKVWQGIKLEQENNLDKAIEYYRQAVELNSQSAVAHHILAIALKKQNNLTEANYYHCLALSLSQNASDRHNPESLASQLDSTALTTQYLSKSDNGAENESAANITRSNTVVLPKLTAVAPGTYVENNQLEVTKIYLQQAKLYYSAQRWQESIDACESALKICVDLPEIYKIYGNSLQQMGKVPEAMGYYAKALMKDPYLAEVYANIGSLYAKQHDWQETINYYQKALAIDPQQAKIHLHLSKAWEQVSEDERALNTLLDALRLQPNILNEAQYLQLSEDLLAENKRQQAIACCEYGIEIHPPSKTLYLKLIEILEQDGQLAKATGYRQIVANLPENNFEPKPKKFKIQRLLTSTSIKHLPEGKKPQRKALKPSTAVANPQKQSAFNTNKDTATLAKYLEELNQQPNSATVRLKLGNLFARQQQWREAAAYYQQAIKIEPKNAIAYLKLGKICGILGKHLEGGELIYRAYSIDPEIATPEEHFKLGEFWLKQNQRKIAMSCYRRAVQLKPGFTAAYNRLRQLIVSEKQQANTLTAGDTEPSSTPQTKEISQDRVYCQQATAAVEAQDWQLATKFYQQAIEVNPQQSNYYYSLGKVQLKLARWQTALKCLTKAAKLDPNNADIQHDLGEILSHEQSWENAATAYKKAIALGRNNSWTYHNLGYALLQLEQWQPAADCFQQAIELKADFVWSHYNLGEALFHLEQWNEASAAYKAALEIEPNLSEAKAKIGDLLYKCSQQSQQTALSFCQSQILQDPDNVELYHQALALDKKNPELYLGLARALVKQGKKDEAISIYQVGLQIQPQNSELIQGLNELKTARTKVPSFNLIAKIDNTASTVSGEEKTEKELVDRVNQIAKQGIVADSRKRWNGKTILAIAFDLADGERLSGGRRIGELLQIFKELGYRAVLLINDRLEERSYVKMLQAASIEVIEGDSEQDTTIEQQLQELLPTIDLAWVCHPQLYEKYAPLIRQHQNIKLIYDTLDLYYLRLQRAAKPEDNDLQNMRQWLQMQKRELKAAQEADLTITISPVEQRILSDRGVSNLAVVPNIHRAYQGERPSFLERKGLLFIGSSDRFDYNYIEKVQCLVQEIMPLVWLQMPELTLTLVEYDSTAEVAALGQDSRIKVTKVDSNLVDYFLHHRILINPLINDANAREKIGESLKFGLPVISTTAGISGMNLVNGHDVLEANRINEFAKQIQRLSDDENLWHKLAANGTEAVDRFSPQAVGQTVQSLFDSILVR